jgi:hypothetical protein
LKLQGGSGIGSTQLFASEEYPLEDSLTPQNKEANSEVEPTIQSIEVLDPVLERVVEGSNTTFSLEENDEYPPVEEPQEFIEKLKNNSSASNNEEGTPTESKETREKT